MQTKRKGNNERVRLSSPVNVFILCSVRACVLCILIQHKVHKGFPKHPPPSPSDRCSLFSSFPSSWHPSVSLFSLQSSSLLPCRHEMLLKTLQQRKQRKRKGRGNKVICSLPLSRNRRGETKVENKRGDEIRREKREGKG